VNPEGYITNKQYNAAITAMLKPGVQREIQHSISPDGNMEHLTFKYLNLDDPRVVARLNAQNRRLREMGRPIDTRNQVVTISRPTGSQGGRRIEVSQNIDSGRVLNNFSFSKYPSARINTMRFDTPELHTSSNIDGYQEATFLPYSGSAFRRRVIQSVDQLFDQHSPKTSE
jgi:hypothetical protein